MERLHRFFVFACCLAAWALWPLAAVQAAFDAPELAQAAGNVQTIIVEGTQRIEPDTVKSYLLIQEGDPFDPARIDRSL